MKSKSTPTKINFIENQRKSTLMKTNKIQWISISKKFNRNENQWKSMKIKANRFQFKSIPMKTNESQCKSIKIKNHNSFVNLWPEWNNSHQLQDYFLRNVSMLHQGNQLGCLRKAASLLDLHLNKDPSKYSEKE